MSLARFKQIIHGLAVLAGARVLALHEPGQTPNFFAAELSLPGEHLFLLCSDEENWAFVNHFEPGLCKLDFRDAEALSEILSVTYGICPLSAAELAADFAPRPGISASDIAYWQPASLGDGLFNWWD